MNLNIRGHEIYLTDDIKKYATDKLDKLCHKYKTIIDIDLVLEENHNKMEKSAAVASALVKIAGKDLAAKSGERTIYAAIDEVERKLDAQLRKEKGLYHDPTNKRFHKSKELIRKLFRR